MLAASLTVPALAMTSASAAVTATPATAKSLAAVTPAGANTVTIHVRANEPYSATGCTHNIFGTELVCIYVNGTGRYVSYATVIDKHGPSGRAYISDTWDGRTFQGPSISPGGSWRYDFNKTFTGSATYKVCGSVSGLDVACVNVS
jgi:hypothetical protein